MSALEDMRVAHLKSDLARAEAKIEQLQYLLDETSGSAADLGEIATLGNINFTVQQAAVLKILLAKKENGASKEAILAAMARRKPECDWSEIKIVDVVICKIRRKLYEARSPYLIETIWGRGYRIYKGEPRQVREVYAERRRKDKMLK